LTDRLLLFKYLNAVFRVPSVPVLLF